LTPFHEAFSCLRFPASFLPGMRAIAYSNSLFSGQVRTSGHVRLAEAAQWRRYFTGRYRQRFLELFGDLLIRLGYEKDCDWGDPK
jgi:hypothetical protein